MKFNLLLPSASRTLEISLLLQCKSIDWSLCNRQHYEVKGQITNYKNFTINK